ncbi:hypothetical protein [Streptomyces sp. R35]|uniref:Uncharacterized protein n=1 Tax=Streptomyces sp. R35 TaxID=3238630 RepID=A0AB39SM01_9ACTN
MTDINWTYFSPPTLIEPGERTGTFRLGGDDLIKDEHGNSRITFDAQQRQAEIAARRAEQRGLWPC